MVYDAFKTHKTDNVNVLLATNNTNLVLVPAGCTSKCQPLDVCINKPFKGVLRNSWEEYVGNIVTNLTETEQQSESFKLPSPSRQNIVNWIAEGIEYLKKHPNMIKDSFSVCGITTTDQNKIRNDEFLKQIMQSVNEKLLNNEEQILDDEDPFLFVE